MVHPIAEKLDKLEGKKSTPCNEDCRYWKFPHLDTACVLSDVFSVRKRQPCYIFEKRKDRG
jgi:hypothetical protein